MNQAHKKFKKAEGTTSDTAKSADRQILWTLLVLVGTLAAALLQLRSPAPSQQVHDLSHDSNRAVAQASQTAQTSPNPDPKSPSDLENSTSPTSRLANPTQPE